MCLVGCISQAFPGRRSGAWKRDERRDAIVGRAGERKLFLQGANTIARGGRPVPLLAMLFRWASPLFTGVVELK